MELCAINFFVDDFHTVHSIISRACLMLYSS